jgi:hypothetical protein
VRDELSGGSRARALAAASTSPARVARSARGGSGGEKPCPVRSNGTTEKSGAQVEVHRGLLVVAVAGRAQKQPDEHGHALSSRGRTRACAASPARVVETLRDREPGSTPDAKLFNVA